MSDTKTWVALGGGLLMTAAGLILSVTTLILLAIVCYAVALLLWLRSRRARKDGGMGNGGGDDPEKGPRGSIGIWLKGNKDVTIIRPKIRGMDHGIVGHGNDGLRIDDPDIKGPKRKDHDDG